MGLGESDTRAKLIDPALHSRGWTEDLIRREETAGAIELIAGKPRKRAKGRVDYTLRVKVQPETQPVAVALIEAKAEHLPPTHGLEQAKAYAACKRMNVPFVFSSNGHLFVEFDRITGLTSTPRPLTEFPAPAELRVGYEQHFSCLCCCHHPHLFFTRCRYVSFSPVNSGHSNRIHRFAFIPCFFSTLFGNLGMNIRGCWYGYSRICFGVDSSCLLSRYRSSFTANFAWRAAPSRGKVGYTLG